MTFGLTPERVDEAGLILQQLAANWTGLLVGSEGYLTAQGRIGLDKQAVVWGEMVSWSSSITLHWSNEVLSAQDSMVRPLSHLNGSR